MTYFRHFALCSLFLTSIILAPRTVRAADFDQAAMRVVVSVRKFTPDEKPSYHHLFLYSGDGKVVRQLTNVDGAHDFNPVFSPDGKNIVFQRNSPRVKDASADGFYWIKDLEKPGAQKIAGKGAVPEWYQRGISTKSNAMDVLKLHMVKREGAARTDTFQTEDGKQILERHENWPSEKDAKPDGYSASDSGDKVVTLWLRDTDTSTSRRLADMPGFETMLNIQIQEAPFLVRPPLRAAFLANHLGSTDGTQEFVLDMSGRKLHVLAPNGGEAILLPPEIPAFLYLCYERYQPLGNGHTTVNCEYFDLWNSDFKRTRFAPNLSDFGGAAVWIPGEKALTIPIEYAPDK